MDVEVVETSPMERQVQVAVDANKVDAESTRALNSLGKRVKVKGFRPGKVPARELRRRYGKSVRRDVIQQLIQSSLMDALNRDDLESVIYVSPPEVVDDEGEGGFSFRFHAEVRPEVNPTGYLGIGLELEEPTAGDDEVDAEIERLRKQHAVIEPVTDRDAVAEGDSVTVSYSPIEAKEGVDFLNAEDVVLHLDEEGVEDAFKTGLIGMGVGDIKEIALDFPEDSPVAERVGATSVALNVTLHAIKRRVLPDIDEDFAEQAGDVETVDALREKIQFELQSGLDAQFKQQKRQACEEKVAELVEFELPKAFLKSRVDDEVERQFGQFRQAGIEPESLGEAFTNMVAQIGKGVERRLRLEFTLRAIAEREKLKVSDDEVKLGIDREIRQAGQHAAQVRRYFANPSSAAGLRERLLLDKTLDFLLAKATISGATPTVAETPAADLEDSAEAPADAGDSADSE